MNTKNYDNLSNAKLLGNLVWYNGPLVALYRAVDGDLYIVSWQDCTDNENIWLWLSVSQCVALLYLRGEVDLLECFKKAEKMVLATEIRDHGTHWETTSFANLKKNDLPDDGYMLTDVSDDEERKALIALLSI